MADKKISQLQEQTDLTGVHAIGVKTENGVSTPCQYDLGGIAQRIETAVKGVVNPDMTDTFDTAKNYYIGQFAVYGGQLYRFVKTHWAGPWNGTTGLNADVVETDIWTEISSVTSTDTEFVHVAVGFADEENNSVTSESLSDISVTLRYDDGKSVTAVTNSDGICSFEVAKGTHYVIGIGQSDTHSGYARPIEQEFLASVSNRYVTLMYRVGTSANCDVTLKVRVSGGTAAQYNGTTAILVVCNGNITEIGQKLNATLTWDASVPDEVTCHFNGVVQGSYATIEMPSVVNYVRPADRTFIVSGTAMTVTTTTTTTSQSGVLYVDGSDFREYILDDYPALPDGTTPATYAYWKAKGLSEEDLKAKFDSVNHPMVAIHVNTADLQARGMDYYVRARDLTDSRTSEITSKQWCNENTNHPNVTTSTSTSVYKAWDGPTNTYYMVYDSANIGVNRTSPAAMWAAQLKYTHNGKDYFGYLGTRLQWQQLINATAQTDPSSGALIKVGGVLVEIENGVYAALRWAGFNNPNYLTKSAFWSSTQSSAANAWYWNVTYSSWYNFYKTVSYWVVPFFAIR